MFPELTFMQKISVLAIPFIFAVTVHELAHAWTAMKLGDRTSEMQGRITLNPIRNIDPLGTIAIPVALLFFSGFIFGWAKAVPVNPDNFKKPKIDMAKVAIAGPISNLVMAIFWVLILKMGYLLGQNTSTGQFLIYSGTAGVYINLIFLVLNMIPIPPLDGSRVATAFLSNYWGYQFNRIEPFGLVILIILMVTGILGPIVFGPLEMIQTFLYQMVGLR